MGPCRRHQQQRPTIKPARHVMPWINIVLGSLSFEGMWNKVDDAHGTIRKPFEFTATHTDKSGPNWLAGDVTCCDISLRNFIVHSRWWNWSRTIKLMSHLMCAFVCQIKSVNKPFVINNFLRRRELFCWLKLHSELKDADRQIVDRSTWDVSHRS